MAFTDIDICASAMVMIGDSPITSFDDGTTQAIIAENLYEATVKELLGSYPWRFCTQQSQLSRLVAAPESVWDAAYQLPNDLLNIETVIVENYPINFDRFEDMIYCDATSTDIVILSGMYRVDEQFWPSYFTSYLRIKLASLFALSASAQVEVANYMERKALREGAVARNRDAQGRTAPKFRTDRIINDRFQSARTT
jgi:hypothetical protein